MRGKRLHPMRVSSAIRGPHDARRRFVNDVRRLFTLAAVLAIASAGLMPPVPTLAQAQPTGEPTPPPKQQCSAKKTKWQIKQCQDYNNSAPGDEYFGRMKMSYLGINNTFKDMVIESGEYTTSQQIINKLNFAVEALNEVVGKISEGSGSRAQLLSRRSCAAQSVRASATGVGLAVYPDDPQAIPEHVL